MKVLYVLSGNSTKSSLLMFVKMEAQFLVKNKDFEYDIFLIKGKGVIGYLKNFRRLIIKINEYKPNVINANYGFSALLSCLQRKVPVVSTFHGSDIHKNRFNLFCSKIAMKLSVFNIFVSKDIYKQSKYKGTKYAIISAPLDLSEIFYIDRKKARYSLGLSQTKKYVLFSSFFNNPVKNAQLAIDSVSQIDNCELIELKNFSRTEVNLYLNACNLQLTTSYRESGPMIVKEAITCGTPVVSTPVGEVPLLINDLDGNYICTYSTTSVVYYINKVLTEDKRTLRRNLIKDLGMDIESVSNKKYLIFKEKCC